MSNRIKSAVWPVLTFTDAPGAMRFLIDAFGFEEGAIITLEDDPSVVTHGELWWPLGGGVMFGTAGKDDTPFGRRVPGNEALYLVSEDPDGLFAQATAAGAEVVNGLADEDYGSRGSRFVTPRATCGASALTRASDLERHPETKTPAVIGEDESHQRRDPPEFT